MQAKSIKTKKYMIVNQSNNVPIKVTGFCNSYSSADEAKRACLHWNKLANTYGTCIVKVVVKT